MKKYILFLAFPLILMACAKLDEHPIGVLAPEGFFASKADGQAAVMGAYAYMAGYEDYGNDIQMLVGMRDDQQKCAYSGDHMNHDLILPVTAANSKTYTQWQRIYTEISSANNAIAGIPNIPADKITEEERSALIAEAKVIRAFNHFRLVRMFGAVPYMDYFVTDPATVKTVTKTPTSEIYTKIIDDLEESKNLLPDKWDAGATPVRSRISKGTAYTILADVYLTRGNWVKAAENALYVINHKSDFGYDLLPDFKNVFDFYAGNDNKEYIWSVDFSSTDAGYTFGRDQLAMLCGLPSWFGWDYGGWGTVYASTRSLLDFSSNDYRRKITFWEDAPMGGVMKHYDLFPQASPAVAKFYRTFIGTPKQNLAWETDLNFPVYRFAEVLLIAAEALNEVNDPSAYTFVNQVRARARNYDGVINSSPVPADFSGLTQTALRDSIILERKRELAFEFKRWFDITRLNLNLNEVFGPSGTDPLPNAGSITQANKLIPIPQTEIDKNPNLALLVE